MISILTFTSLITIFVASIFLYKFIIDHPYKTTVATAYAVCSALLFFESGAYLNMLAFNEYINPAMFEYVAQICSILLSATVCLITLMYWLPIKKYTILLPIYIIPIFLTLGISTNEVHHLYYVSNLEYNFSNIELGPLYIIASIYKYVAYILPILIVLVYSIKNKLLLSKKNLIYFVLILIPAVFNIISNLKIFDTWSIFTNTIITGFCISTLSVIILEYKLRNVESYAKTLALDTMVDPFVVVNANSTILLCNQSFNNTIGKLYNLSLYDNIHEKYAYSEANQLKKFDDALKKINKNNKIVSVRHTVSIRNKTYVYNVNISEITLENLSIGFLFFFNDITGHLNHLSTIKEQKNIIFSQDRLATIGKLASSFAKDIDTPLKTIDNGIDYLKQSKLFESDDLDIYGQMKSCTERISDIAANLVSTYSENGKVNESKFEVNEAILPIKYIVGSELKKYDCSLKINSTDPVYITGNKTKFNQVITNIVINAIQAYDKKKNGVVYINIMKTKAKVIINIIDNAGGISSDIRETLFKKVVTTKGKKGTGLGLRLSHSIINNDFGGSLVFESDKVGTTFSISIPLDL